MSMKERHEQILNLLKNNHFLSVSKLSGLLYVSEPTIRRDLSALEKEGFVKRNRGGAVYIADKQIQFPSDFRFKENIEAKNIIALLALRYIHSGNHIFMDASSSSYYLAKAIGQDKNLHVFTNGLLTADILAKSKKINIEIPGGNYDARNKAIFGITACHQAQNRFVNTCFISTVGLDLEWGLSSMHTGDAELTKAFHSCAEKTILLVDHTKLNQRFYVHTMELSEIDVLITDQPLPPDYQNYCNIHQIEVVTPQF